MSDRGESNFLTGGKTLQVCHVHVQNDEMLLQVLWISLYQQQKSARVPASMRAGTEEDWQAWGAQSRQRWLGKNHGSHSVPPQEGEWCSTDICGHGKISPNLSGTIDNDHSMVTHPPQMPTYSTELIIEIRVVILCNLSYSGLSSTSDAAITQKISSWLCIFTTLGTMMILRHLLLDTIQCMYAGFFWKSVLTSSVSKQCYQPNLSSPLKNIFTHATYRRHVMVFLVQEENFLPIVNYLHHICHICCTVLMTQDVSFSVQWLPLSIS